LDNIPLYRRQEKTPTQLRAFPPFLESDQENEPPVQVPGPAIVPPQEPPHAPVLAPDAMRAEPVPDEVFVPVPTDVPAPVEEGKDKVSTVVAQVLEIIPDVQPDHLLALVEQHLPTYQAQVLQHVLHTLFEDASYPKVEKKAKGKRKVEVEEDPAPVKKAKIDYGSTERQFQRGRYYVDLSLVSLSSLLSSKKPY
jgi:TRIAD3 protein (E3 ubiquitin-protein ligase RNF216)